VIKKKNGLAANNGDTLGEAVISVEVINSDQNIKKKSAQNNKQKNCTSSSSLIFFQRSFKRCKLITVLKISKP
jgi:hypothetical protein